MPVALGSSFQSFGVGCFGIVVGVVGCGKIEVAESYLSLESPPTADGKTPSNPSPHVAAMCLPRHSLRNKILGSLA